MQNALTSNEWPWIWACKTFKTKIQKEGPNNSEFLQNWLPPEVRSPVFNLHKFQDSEESTPETCRMHGNLMNDDEFPSTKLLKLKYRRGEEIIQTLCKTGSTEKLGPRSLFCRNFKTLRKVLLNHAECMRSNEWRWIWIHKTFKIEIQKPGPNNSDSPKLVPPRNQVPLL